MLGKDFFERQHSKPIFNNNKLMTVHNLYFYHCITSIFKVMKYWSPISIHNIIQPMRSKLQITRFNPPPPDHNYFYNACKLWNRARQLLNVKTLEHKFSIFKSAAKNLMLRSQLTGIDDEWNDHNLLNTC